MHTFPGVLRAGAIKALAAGVARHLLVLLGFAAGAVLLTYPLLFVGGTSIVGNSIASEDGWQKVWDLWWFRQSLLEGHHPFQSDYIFWPLGINLLVYQTYAFSTLLLSLPVLLPFGPVAAYKYSMLLSFALSGYTMFVLARFYTQRWSPALVAGLLYMATPVHLSRFADGSHLTAMQWLPLYLLALALWLERGRIWQGVAASALLVVLFFTSLYYTQFALVWTAAAVPIYAIVTRQPWQTCLRAGAVLLVWALLCLPVLQQNLGTDIHYRDWHFRQRFHSIDLLDLLIPSSVHPLWGRLELNRLTHPAGVGNVVTGLGVLLVGSYGLWRQRARFWPWAVLAVIMLLFALGPTLHIAHHNTHIPMPHSLLNLTDAGRGSNRPGHFLVMTVVVLTLGVALALQQRRTRTVLAVGALLFVCDSLPPLPWPTVTLAPPGWQQALEEVPPGALVQVPFLPRLIDYQAAQFWHGRPITGGYVSRTPPDPVHELPALKRLMGTAPATIIGGTEEAQLRAALGGLCARALLIHSDPRRSDEPPLSVVRQQIDSMLPEARLLYDGDPLVYRLPPLPPMPLLVPGEGWYQREHDEQRVWQWTQPHASLLLVNPLEVPLPIWLHYEAQAASVGQSTQIHLDGALLWQGQIGHAQQRSYMLRLDPRHTHTLTFTTDAMAEETAATSGTRSERSLGLVFTRLEARPAASADLSAACPPVPALTPALPAYEHK